MRVLQIHNSYRLPGGEDTVAETEALLLRGAGHDVDRMWVRNPTDATKTVGALARAPWREDRLRALRRELRVRRPDVAHVHNTWFALTPSVIEALARERVPTVMTLHNYRLFCANASLFREGRTCTLCLGSHPWHGVRHACYRESRLASIPAAATIALNRARRTWDSVARFLCLSHAVRGLFVDAGVDEHKITVKPNVVADPGPRAHPPSTSRTLLYVGRMTAEKGVDVLVDAWRQAAVEAPDLELVLVGDGPLRSELEQKAPPRTAFLGWVDDHEVRRRMLEARALVFPSVWFEAFGRVTVEAFAAGLPVLASDLATPAEVVGELGGAWLARAGDSAAWSTALARLSEDRAIDAAGGQARTLFEERYTLQAGLRSLVTVYEEVGGAHDRL